MKFSLWMFYDALKEFEPEISIKHQDKPNIENIRLHSSDADRMDNTLYVEKSDVFFHNGIEDIICMHGDNMIILNTRHLNKVFNTLFDFWEDTQKWFNNVTAMISNNCTLKDVLNQFKEKIPFPLMVLDSSQVALAISEEYGLGSIDDKWDKMLITGSFGADVLAVYNHKYQDMLKTNDYYSIAADPFPFPSYNHNIFINNEFMGFFSMILRRNGLSNVHKAWFGVAFELVTAWMTIYAGRNDILIKNAFFQEILEGNFKNADRFKAALATQGWSTDPLMKIAVLSCVSNILNMNPHVIKLINQASPYMYAIEYQNKIVVLADSSMLPENKVKDLIKPILQSTGYYGGASNAFSDINDINHYLSQAMLPVKSGPPPVGEIETCNNYIIPYIMEILSKNAHMNISHPALLILKEHDAKHGNNYYELLRKYLQDQCNQTRASEHLNMHRSSLIRKIKHICELTAIDLDDVDTRLHLLISYEFEKFTD